VESSIIFIHFFWSSSLCMLGNFTTTWAIPQPFIYLFVYLFIYLIVCEIESHEFAQIGLKLIIILFSTSQVAGIIEMYHHAWLSFSSCRLWLFWLSFVFDERCPLITQLSHLISPWQYILLWGPLLLTHCLLFCLCRSLLLPGSHQSQGQRVVFRSFCFPCLPGLFLFFYSFLVSLTG
jgi:hypothetical protein